MSKKQPNLSALSDRIAHKTNKKPLSNDYEKFQKADEALQVNEVLEKERVIRKSYVLTNPDIQRMEGIKDKLLDHKIVINDSHVIRLALKLASNATEAELIGCLKEVPKLAMGRPKEK